MYLGGVDGQQDPAVAVGVGLAAVQPGDSS
jgi:hypothetical protein